MIQERRENMKKVIYLLLGIWSAIAGFLSPVWLTLTVLNLTGLTYQYDYSMDEGTALILGLIMLFIWVLFALIPCIIFLKKMRLLGRKVLAWSIIGLVVLTLLGIVTQILRFPEIQHPLWLL